MCSVYVHTALLSTTSSCVAIAILVGLSIPCIYISKPTYMYMYLVIWIAWTFTLCGSVYYKSAYVCKHVHVCTCMYRHVYMAHTCTCMYTYIHFRWLRTNISLTHSAQHWCLHSSGIFISRLKRGCRHKWGQGSSLTPTLWWRVCLSRRGQTLSLRTQEEKVLFRSAQQMSPLWSRCLHRNIGLWLSQYFNSLISFYITYMHISASVLYMKMSLRYLACRWW